MSQNTIKDLIDLGWTDEKIKELTGCDDEYLNKIKGKSEDWFNELVRMCFRKGMGRN